MSIGKKILVVAAVTGAMMVATFGIGAIKDHQANVEIDDIDYQLVSSWAFNEKLGPEIKKATADGIITQAEFNRLNDLKDKVQREETISDINTRVDDIKTIRELRERIDKLSKEAEE